MAKPIGEIVLWTFYLMGLFSTLHRSWVFASNPPVANIRL